MAIAEVSSADLGTNGGSGPLTTAFTVGAGSLGFLVIDVAGDTVGGADDVTATYNGTNAPLLAKYTNPTGGDRMLYKFGQYAPTSGSHNVVVTPAGSHAVYASCTFYTGVKQSGQPDNTTTNVEASPASLTLTTAITPVADNCWPVLAEGCYDGGPGVGHPGAGTGSTLRARDAVDGALGMFDGNAPIHPAAAYSMTTTRVSNPFNLAIAHLLITLAPDTGGGATVAGPLVNASRLKGLVGGALVG